jgi:hypothetical protein
MALSAPDAATSEPYGFRQSGLIQSLDSICLAHPEMHLAERRAAPLDDNTGTLGCSL